MHNKNILTKERIDSLREIRNKKREEAFATLVPAMGEEAVEEIRKIYSMFDERMLVWMANLWEPNIGGFYYSNSARDHEGFLPDLESTHQAVIFITEQCGLVAKDQMHITAIPERFASKMADFAYNLQDEDGSFYHPQWGKNITATRKGRDGAAAWRLIEPLGRKCKYLRLSQRPKNEETKAALPEFLSSTDTLLEWLEGQRIEERSYQFGHYINSTTTNFFVAGQEYVDTLVAWLNSKNRADNGLWEPQVNYSSVNGLMKLSLCYPGFGAKLPYPEKSYESARAAVLSDEPLTFACEFYNAWAAVNNSIKSMDGEMAEAYREKLKQDAPEMIRVTGEKMAKCRVDDGSFAYFTAESGKTCPRSQGALVGLEDVREGDINGNGCSTSAPLRHLFAAFGVEKPTMFTPEDAELIFELMDNAVSPVKKPL